MVVFYWKTTVLHGTLCSSLFCMTSERLKLGAACWSDAEQNELQTDMANTFFSFFLFSKKKSTQNTKVCVFFFLKKKAGMCKSGI